MTTLYKALRIHAWTVQDELDAHALDGWTLVAVDQAVAYFTKQAPDPLGISSGARETRSPAAPKAEAHHPPTAGHTTAERAKSR